MNKGVWLVFEVLFDTLMFAPYLLRGRYPARVKARILLTYARLSLKLLLIHPVRSLQTERVFGFTIRCFDYRTMHLLFRVILLRKEYYFETEKDRPVILDCGANIGLATLFFKWLYPRSEIHAFEPDSETFALLRENVEGNNLAGVHLHEVALSDSSGTADFHVDRGNPGALRMSLNPRRMPKDRITVRTLVSSEFLEAHLAGREVDFLKLDVEGAEDAVLRDLVTTGRVKAIKEMLIEIHYKIGGERGKLGPFLTMLETHGFDYQMDAVCMPLYGRGKFQNIMLYVYRA